MGSEMCIRDSPIRTEPRRHNWPKAELATQETPYDRDALLPRVVGEPPGLQHVLVEPLELGFDPPVWLARLCDSAARPQGRQQSAPAPPGSRARADEPAPGSRTAADARSDTEPPRHHRAASSRASPGASSAQSARRSRDRCVACSARSHETTSMRSTPIHAPQERFARAMHACAAASASRLP